MYNCVILTGSGFAALGLVQLICATVSEEQDTLCPFCMSQHQPKMMMTARV